MLSVPVPVSPTCSASAMTEGLLLEICTGPPPEGGVSVMVIGIWRFCPTVPPVIVTKFGPPEEMLIEKLADALSWGLLESFTVTFKLLVPAAVGVPLITPVAGSIVSPVGNPDADHV